MSFLGLSFLFALPLAAVPVIIHLYRGRQRDVVNWGAMQFLTAATTKGRSMQRLEELLLMFLRTAAVLALVLALAQPMLRSSLFGSAVDREVVLLLDNSLSMNRTIEKVAVGDLLTEKALAILDDLSSGDTVQLMLASGGGQWLTAEGIPADTIGKRQLTSLIEAVEPTLGSAKLLDCLQSIVNSEPQNNPSSRQVYVLSDHQAVSWQLESTGGWQQLGAAREKSAIPTAIEYVDCQLEEAELNNLAVMKLEASRQLVRPKERVELVARISNVGEVTSAKTVVEWLIDDEVFDTSELRSLAAGESTQVSMTLKQEDTGNFAITARIQVEDQIALDGEASVVVEVSDELPILVVHDREADTARKTADQLFTAALGYDGEKAQEWHSVYRPEIVSAAELGDIALPKYRAIVMLSLTQLSDETHQRLLDFVRAGGGLWVALGDLVEREAFNRFWYDDGGGLSPISLESLITVQDTNTPPGSIHPPERGHPVTMQLANTTQLDIDQVRLTDYWQLVHQGEDEPAAWVLLESGDGSPLVVENLVGEGRVLIQAFPLGLEWTNLPQLKSYVVMVHDWLDYLTAPAMARFNLEPGNAIAAPLPADVDGATAKLITPAGEEVELATAGGEESGLVRYSQTQLPGLYRVNFEAGGKSTSLPFYVARDASESQAQSLEIDDQARLTELAGLQFEGQDTEVTSAVANLQPRPKAEPIWGVLLIALVGLLIGEQLLSNWLARQRSGVAVSTG